jgi:hypothetical protein
MTRKTAAPMELGLKDVLWGFVCPSYLFTSQHNNLKLVALQVASNKLTLKEVKLKLDGNNPIFDSLYMHE